MKKTFIIAILLFGLSVSANAANGDVVGKIYSTDIRAYINGVEVPSYNIGGKTVIVIEDILNETMRPYAYDDNSRTLKLFSLDPYYLVEGKAQGPKKSGEVLGNIYETDIKTSIYNVNLPTYNIGGKTAVAIEDLGCDKAFSPIGGKYIWNAVERTISLEFMYDNWFEVIPDDKVTTISINKDLTEFEATFDEAFHCEGGQLINNIFVEDAEKIEGLIPIRANGETIGYYSHRYLENDVFNNLTYFLFDKITEASKTYTPAIVKTKEDVILHFINHHSTGEPMKRFDTEKYSFIYISVAMTSSTSYNLLQVYNDGTYIDYREEIYQRNRSPIDLTIDEENEKVTFKYRDRYTPEWVTNYEIDLKSGTIKEV